MASATIEAVTPALAALIAAARPARLLSPSAIVTVIGVLPSRWVKPVIAPSVKLAAPSVIVSVPVPTGDA